MVSNSFKTQNYEGAWIPFDGDRGRFRLSVQEYLREALADPNGELSVDDRGPHWKGVALKGLSYSHSVDWGVLVFSRMHELGVDIEKEHRELNQDPLKIAERFFHPEEFEMLRLQNPFELRHAFVDLWLKKESYSKTLRVNLDQVIHSRVTDSKCEFEILPKTRITFRGVVAIR